jgi:hypothetical protein
VANRLVRPPDLTVVDHTILPEQEKDIAVVEPLQTAGKLDEQRFRRNVVGKEVLPEGEHAVTARKLPEEEQRSLAAFFKDRGVELRTEEPVRCDQPVEPFGDVAFRKERAPHPILRGVHRQQPSSMHR